METKLKKHELILKEINRMSEADRQYCVSNNCTPNHFLMGKGTVYKDLIVFINKLNGN